MYNLRKRLFIIISVIVAVVLAIVLFVVVLQRGDGGEVATDIVFEEDPVEDTTPTVQPTFEPLPQPVIFQGDELSLRQLARVFTERFFTYSNQNDNSHIEAVDDLVTDSMRRYVISQQISANDTYEGVTTRVVAMSLGKLDNESAIIFVDTQQEFEQLGIQDVSYRSGRIEFVFVDNEWKVDGFFWE